MTIIQLCEMAEKNNDVSDINSALGEVTVAGQKYQIQLSLIANKKLWCKPDEARFTEVVKIH